MLRSIRRTLGNISAVPGTTTCVEVAAQILLLREMWRVLLRSNFHSSHSPRPRSRSAPWARPLSPDGNLRRCDHCGSGERGWGGKAEG